MIDDDFWSNPFHSCALAAYVEVAFRQQGWPDSETTRRLAYQFYENELAEKNREAILIISDQGRPRSQHPHDQDDMAPSEDTKRNP